MTGSSCSTEVINKDTCEQEAAIHHALENTLTDIIHTTLYYRRQNATNSYTKISIHTINALIRDITIYVNLFAVRFTNSKFTLIAEEYANAMKVLHANIHFRLKRDIVMPTFLQALDTKNNTAQPKTYKWLSSLSQLSLFFTVSVV